MFAHFLFDVHRDQVSLLSAPRVIHESVKKDQTTRSDFPHTVGMCVDLYCMEGGLSFPRVSGQASAEERASPLHTSIVQSTRGTDWDKTKRDESAL